jgi:hypothetical protein
VELPIESGREFAFLHEPSMDSSGLVVGVVFFQAFSISNVVEMTL